MTTMWDSSRCEKKKKSVPYRRKELALTKYGNSKSGASSAGSSMICVRQGGGQRKKRLGARNTPMLMDSTVRVRYAVKVIQDCSVAAGWLISTLQEDANAIMDFQKSMAMETEGKVALK
jgi:hypothetical protein